MLHFDPPQPAGPPLFLSGGHVAMAPPTYTVALLPSRITASAFTFTLGDEEADDIHVM